MAINTTDNTIHAFAFAMIAVIVGGIANIFSWCSMCVAFHGNGRMKIIYALCMFLKMLFFASEICVQGYSIEKTGVLSIVSGFAWMIAAGLSYKSCPIDSSLPKASCCCCPMSIASSQNGVYTAVHAIDDRQRYEELSQSIVIVERRPSRRRKYCRCSAKWERGTVGAVIQYTVCKISNNCWWDPLSLLTAAVLSK